MDGDGSGDTGGNGGTQGGSGWDDEDSNGLWGWLSGIADGISAIWEAVATLPQLILELPGKLVEGFRDFFEMLGGAVMAIPTAIGEILKDFFLPDTEYIDQKFTAFREEMAMRFAFDTEFFEGLFASEAPVTDTYMDYNIPGVGAFKLKVFDTKFLVDGVTYFRPFIRGFLVLMMALYHIRQLIGFFGYDAGVVAGRSEHIAEARKAQKEA